MFKLLCVTNRALVKEDFRERLEKIASAGVDSIILREKELDEEQYLALCKGLEGLPIVPHTFVEIALELGKNAIHLPLSDFFKLEEREKSCFQTIGVSCHSIEEARRAEELGAGYLTAGHIFETNCKRGVPARGLVFLEQVCKSVRIPVYAIGGICAENIHEVRERGAAGACVMSGAMLCDDPKEYFRKLREGL